MGNMEKISFRKKDFRIEWYSGSGAGGQHRNKHQNCCRITHIESGLRAQGTESRERSSNQRRAFWRLAKLLVLRYAPPTIKERFHSMEVVRNYHGGRNEVHDKASGLKSSYRDVVTAGNLGEMIEARRRAMFQKLEEQND